MKNVMQFAVVAFIATFAVVAAAPDASAAAKHRSAYATKKADCTRQANARKFGIHFIQRNRWIKNCIAGRA
jgi:hypothetical protein